MKRCDKVSSTADVLGNNPRVHLLCRSESLSRRKRKHSPQPAFARHNGLRPGKLTPQQRRREVVELLAAALAEMPAALALPDGAAASFRPAP